MKRFAGLDVSLSTTSICVVDGKGHIVFEGVVTTDPDAIGAVLAPHGPDLVGLEAGPMSEWLHAGLSRHGLATVLMETRHVHAALKASLIKTDRRDAHGIAQLLRMGWFRPVHVKTASARERRVLLGARDTLVRRLRDLDNSVRGLLRGFGLRPPRLLRERWSGAVRRLIAVHPVLVAAIDPILVARDRPQRGARPPRQAGPGSGARRCRLPPPDDGARCRRRGRPQLRRGDRRSDTLRQDRRPWGRRSVSPPAAINPVRPIGQARSPRPAMPERGSRSSKRRM